VFDHGESWQASAQLRNCFTSLRQAFQDQPDTRSRIVRIMHLRNSDSTTPFTAENSLVLIMNSEM